MRQCARPHHAQGAAQPIPMSAMAVGEDEEGPAFFQPFVQKGSPQLGMCNVSRKWGMWLVTAYCIPQLGPYARQTCKTPRVRGQPTKWEMFRGSEPR